MSAICEQPEINIPLAVPRARSVQSRFDGVRWPALCPLIALLLMTAVFRATSLDLLIAGLFYDAVHSDWPWYSNSICQLYRHRGVYPGFALAFIGAAWLVWSLVRWRTWRSMQPGMFLVAVFLVGPGLIINQGFKNFWGRPRPYQVQQFGGEFEYVPVGTPGMVKRHNSSFPSGHAAVAFYLLTPAFLVDHRRRKLARGLMTAGIAYGLSMGLVRIAQGAHFTSDVMWSAAVVYFTALALSRLLLRSGE